MKRMEKLGEKVTPLRLIFIKFLLDHDMHQGLYNIQMVIGKRFYIINDIDGLDDGPVLIEMRNDESTDYQWVFVILDEQFVESEQSEEDEDLAREKRIEENRKKYYERREQERKERRLEEKRRKKKEEKLRQERLRKIRQQNKKNSYR
jgi:hypothetical protein